MSSMRQSESDSYLTVKKSRKSHKKSRAGCKNCKRRRIKCDETKPGCRNCADFRIHCDFDPSLPSIIEPTSSPSPSASGRRRRGRPRKGWDLLGSPSTASSAASSPAGEGSLTASVTSEPVLNIADLELMHHYSTCTYLDLGGGGIGVMWKMNVPQLGFSQDCCVLHNAMALAGMHLAYLRPDRRDHYAALAAHHSTIGLQKTSEILANLDEGNCQALYVSAVLVCLYVFAKGPSPGDYMVFSENGPSEWFPLLQGVRSIIEMYGHQVLFTGALSPMVNGPRRAVQPTAVREQKPRIDWEKPFDDLRQFIALSGLPDSATYMTALEGLAQCYEGTYGKGPDASYTGDTANQVVLGWLYRMEQEFIHCLQQKHPLALIILAYFSPLLKSMETIWFMKGWAEHIITGVHGFIGESYWSWLFWPVGQLELAASHTDVVQSTNH